MNTPRGNASSTRARPWLRREARWPGSKSGGRPLPSRPSGTPWRPTRAGRRHLHNARAAEGASAEPSGRSPPRGGTSGKSSPAPTNCGCTRRRICGHNRAPPARACRPSRSRTSPPAHVRRPRRPSKPGNTTRRSSRCGRLGRWAESRDFSQLNTPKCTDLMTWTWQDTHCHMEPWRSDRDHSTEPRGAETGHISAWRRRRRARAEIAIDRQRRSDAGRGGEGV